MGPDHVVDDPLRNYREDEDHQRGQDRAGQRARRHPRIPLQILEYAPDRCHPYGQRSGVRTLHASKAPSEVDTTELGWHNGRAMKKLALWLGIAIALVA